MSVTRREAHAREPQESAALLVQQAFSRTTGAPLVEGNSIQLLVDARENYPAWLEAIREARHHVYLESYIVYDDDIGAMFAEALIAKAREGVRVRVIYDWMGDCMRGSRRYWSRLRAAGIAVRCYNPPRLASPLGWLSREHRKTISVDGRIGVVAGLCIGRLWAGDPEKHREPWRDTGVLVRGPAVAELDRAFAEVWAATGDPIPPEELTRGDDVARQGKVALRVIATAPSTASMFRVDQLVAALARDRLWLADAYFVGTTTYVQALCSAAADGVDVRLLVPGASDNWILKPLSRAGFRRLLRAGVRVFEWNGPMMHAKTAVADGRWARVGSTNLNISGWFVNYELDIIAEDETFALEMEQAYLRDLENATELVLEGGEMRQSDPVRRPTAYRAGGSASRAAAGAVRIGNAVGAALKAKGRTLASGDVRISLVAGGVCLALALLFVLFPRVLAFPVAVILGWAAFALFYKGHREHRRARRPAQRFSARPAAPRLRRGRSSPASR
jgi:cardiolipin synthase A/B